MTLTFHFLVETNCLTKSGWVSLRINCMSGGSPAGVALRTRCGSGRLFLDVLQLFLGGSRLQFAWEGLSLERLPCLVLVLFLLLMV